MDLRDNHISETHQKEDCILEDCSSWGYWSLWNTCDRTCDGERKRHRNCHLSKVLISSHVFFKLKDISHFDLVGCTSEFRCLS